MPDWAAPQDGRISAEELLRVNFLNAWARRDMDTDRDGLLSRCRLASRQGVPSAGAGWPLGKGYRQQVYRPLQAWPTKRP